ncbi:hypothetical protein NL676_012587 [Syzygium grande]|nr:hypothetical protein NL676_012587 [Syzygium grande]
MSGSETVAVEEVKSLLFFYKELTKEAAEQQSEKRRYELDRHIGLKKFSKRGNLQDHGYGGSLSFRPAGALRKRKQKAIPCLITSGGAAEARQHQPPPVHGPRRALAGGRPTPANASAGYCKRRGPRLRC